MNKPAATCITILLLGLLFCGTAVAATTADWTPTTITDSDGNTVTISAYPDKIISLAPACTEIIYAVGAGNRLVGDTYYCNYPEEAKTVEKIGEFSNINREKIIALSTGNSIIFANPTNGKDTIDYLKKQGCTIVVVNPASIDGIYDAISLIGTATGCKEQAKTLITDMKNTISTISAKVSSAKTPTVIHVIGTDPYYISGKNTFQNDLITLAGGVNAFADVDGWKAITLEKLLVTDPDIILTDPGENGEPDIYKTFMTEPRLASLKAVKTGQIYVMDADTFNRGGPRATDALQTLGKILHPEIFGAAKTPAPAKTPGWSIPIILTGIIAAGILRKRNP